ncbi:hypothetical protein [Winogradskyella sp.]|uniref:hypothetical protein n=1 Tax=Winogradskyella sp. TaxID=1883156 RepID=UPI003BAD26B3
MNYKIEKLTTINAIDSILYLKLDNDLIRVLKFHDEKLVLENYNSIEYNFIDSIEFQINDIVFEKIYDFQFFPEIEKFCICFGDVVALFNRGGSIFLKHKRDDGILSSYFVDHQTLYLELYEFSGNRALGIWNMASNTIKELELESYGHYNRNFKIENTNTILYGTANAYWCGVHLHVLSTEKDTLSYINEKNLVCGRHEIECYAISINSIGDEFLIITENDNGKIPFLCYYSIFNQSQPIAEFRLFEHSNILSNYLDTSFLLDDILLVVTRKKIGLLKPSMDSKNQNNTFNLIKRDENSCYTLNNEKGQFLCIRDNQIYSYTINEKSFEIPVERKHKMNNFLSDIKKGEFQVKEVGE